MSTPEGTLSAATAPVDRTLPVDLAGSELKRGAFVNTLAMLASNLRSIFTLLVAWILGPAILGLFAVAWATTDLISKVGVFGLDNAITTFISRSEALGNHARTRMLFRLANGLGILFSVIVALLTVLFAKTIAPRFGWSTEMANALAITICALPGIALYRISTSVSRGMKVMKHDIYSRGFTESLATTAAFLIAMLLGFRTFAPEIAAIGGTAAAGIVAFILASKLFADVRGDSETNTSNEARSLLAYSAPIAGHQLLNTLISRLDVILLGSFIGRAPGVTLVTVGIYAAVVDLANGLRKVNQAFNPIFAPVVARMTAVGDQEQAAATYARLAQWMLWILLPAVAVMALAGSTILMVYGPKFAPGGAWLGIVALASATNAFVSLGETVIMVQRPHINLIHSIITCVVAAVCLLLLIPRYGAAGAAMAVVFPYLVQGALRYFTMKHVFGWKEPWSRIRPPVIAAVIALALALPSRLFLTGLMAQIVSALVFLALFGGAWLYHSRTRATS